MSANREAWNEYRTTWKEFSRQLSELQHLVESGDREAVECALLNVEKARLSHNEARDRLAACLSGKPAPVLRDEKRVRNTAQLLWEFAGKPQGTAERDWFRAERLVRTASAQG